MAELQWKVPEPIQPLQGAYAHYSASCMSKESGNVFFVQQQSSSPVTLRPLGKHNTNATSLLLYLTVNC